MATPAIEHISGDHLIGPVMDLEMARQRLQQFQQFIKEYMVEGEDYGTIPGTPKPTLLKPGADKLCELYGLADNYEVTQRTEDFKEGLFDYEVKCIITSKRGGFLVSTGLGSCNSFEKKYRWRDSQRKCPNCNKECIIKGKDEYGGGWLCFAKKGGCGAKFTDGDPDIVNQTVGKVQNEDVADLKNTVLKMAKKRAKIDATLSATRSSGVFTQDVEDWDLPKVEKHEPKPDPTPASTPVRTVDAEKPASTQSNGVESTTKPEPPKPAPKPKDPPFQPKLYEDVLLCEVKDVFERKSREGKGASYLLVELRVPWEGKKYLFNWHASLFDALKTAAGKVCRFHIVPGTKDTISIEDIKHIGEVPYVKGKVEGAEETPAENPDSEPAEVATQTQKKEWKMWATKGTNLVGVGWEMGTLRCAFAGKDGPRFYIYFDVDANDANKLVKSPYPDKLFNQLKEKNNWQGGPEVKAA